MSRIAAILGFLAFVLCWHSPLMAISPEEQLANPRLEQRAREISAQLRCLVCQNQSIEESDADLAKDLRREVRTQLSQGLGDEVILSNLQRTYGDYILLNPPVNRATYLLWGAPILLLLLAGFMFWQSRRRAVDMAQSQAHLIEEPEQTHQPEPKSDAAFSPRLTMGLLLVIIIASAALYSQLGSPSLEAQPLEGRQQERLVAQQQEAQEQAALQQALTEAIEAAAKTPESVEAQLGLALAFARVNDFGNEIVALRRALALSQDAPVIKAMLAEALSREADGQITLPARELISEVLGLVPNEPRALFMAGLAAYQDEAYGAAIEIWSQLHKTSPQESPWPELAKRNIIIAAQEGGLEIPEGFEDGFGAGFNENALAIANASEAEQEEMIAAMVEGLEARLADNPEDKQGWQRLVQARRVLGDRDGLLRALAGAAQAQPDDKDAQLDMLEAVLVGNQDRNWLDAAEQALARLAKLDDRALEYLFFAGHIARLKGDASQAKTHWQSLYDLIGEGDAGFKAQLKQQIDALE